MNRLRRTAVLAVLMVMAVAGVSCGDDDGETTDTTGPATTDSATTTEAASPPGPIEPLAEPVTVRLVVAQQMSNFPLHVAIEKGYFEQAGLDVQVETVRGTTQEFIPRLVQGEIDLMQSVPSPALYNQVAEGFDVNVITAMGDEMAGRISFLWLTKLTELDAEIQEIEDLEGRTVEAVAEGSAPQLVLYESLRDAGLDPETDVNLTYRVRQGPPDLLALAQNKAADVIGMPEPFASVFEGQGVVVKWLSGADLVPWYQPHILLASEQFQADNAEALTKFLEVYLQAVREINAAEGEWSDELAQIAATWNGVQPDQIIGQGGVPYFDPNGLVSLESLERTQDLWVELGLVPDPIDVAGELVDTSTLDEAVALRGKE